MGASIFLVQLSSFRFLNSMSLIHDIVCKSNAEAWLLQVLLLGEPAFLSFLASSAFRVEKKDTQNTQAPNEMN